jgi:hypothetical protein
MEESSKKSAARLPKSQLLARNDLGIACHPTGTSAYDTLTPESGILDNTQYLGAKPRREKGRPHVSTGAVLSGTSV